MTQYIYSLTTVQSGMEWLGHEVGRENVFGKKR
jgi:hypothetical protein